MDSPFGVAIIVAVVTSSPVFAQTANDHASHHATPARSAASASALTEGVVRSVDRKEAEITLKHGPIPNLAMPPMTMSFKAKDPSMLDRLKVGDKVRFAAEEVGGRLIVVKIDQSQ